MVLTGSEPDQLSEGNRRYLEQAKLAAERFAESANSAATLIAYGSDFADFRSWCDELQLSSLPAEPETVAAYLASLADARLKATTIGRRKAAIAFRHRNAGLESPTTSKVVKATMRGLNRTLGTASEGKAPATGDIIQRVLSHIGTLSKADLRDRALLSLGFAAALRRSELVGLDVEDLHRAREGVVVQIRRSKTDQEGRGQTVSVPKGSVIRPIAALDAWLQAAGIGSGPIFRQVDKADRVSAKRLGARSVADVIKKRFQAAGLDPEEYAGHSLRSGFVTTALAHGTDVFAAADHARHAKLETTRVYDRRRKAFATGKGFL